MTDLNPENLIKLDPEVVKDPLIKKLCESLINRSNMGILKYGNTMEDVKKSLSELIWDAIEESCDQSVYLFKAHSIILKLENLLNSLGVNSIEELEKLINDYRARNPRFKK